MSRKTTKIKRRGLHNAVIGATIAKLVGTGQLPPIVKTAKFTWGEPWFSRALRNDPRP